MDINVYLKTLQDNKDKVIGYASKRINIQRAVKLTVASFVAYYTLNKLYVAFFGVLSNVPGPFLTRFTTVPSLKYNIASGRRFQLIKMFHEKYGHVVRLSPSIISISDKDMMKQILVTDDLPKSPVYDLVARKGTPNLFSTRDKNFHRQRRRVVSPAFSIKYLNSLEPFMTTVTQSLIDKIGKDIENTKDEDGYGVVDIWMLMQCLALDVIGETAFGQTFKMIENNNHFIPGVIKHEMKSTAVNGMFPILSRIFVKSATQTDPRLYNFLKDIIEHRISVKGEERKDILQSLLDSQKSVNDEDRLAADAIMSETILFLVAGSETTSNTLGFAIIELLRHPEKLKKLYAEIDQVSLEEGQKIFNHEQLKHLRYLNAVINETLRIDAVAAGGMPRVTAEKTVLGNNLVLPKGITVITNVYDVQTSSDYWENPLEFIPERWIPEESDNIKPADLDAFFPFSSGPRNCIGKNFALQEMRVALSSFLKYYEMAPIEKELEDSKDVRLYITLGVKKNSFKVRVKHRK